jgi:hypothetical protein
MNRRRLGISLLTCAMLGAVAPSIQGASAYADDPPPPSACTNIPLARITTFDDGGLDYQFDTPAGVVESPIPPVGLNILTATADQLEQYGLPARPAALTDLAEWVTSTTAMVVSLLADLPTLCWDDSAPIVAQPNSEVLFSTTAGQINTTYMKADIWAGESVRPASGVTYTNVSGKFVQPSRLTSCSGSRESTWVGIGGARARADGSAGLIQAGTAYGPSGAPVAWYEWVGNDAAGNPIGVTQQSFSGITVHPGDQMSFQVQYVASTHRATFTANNLTTNVTKVFASTLGARFYDGRDGEWIVERPTVVTNNVQTLAPLQNFGTAKFTAAKVKNSSGDWIYGGDAHQQIAYVMENTDSMVLASPGAFYGTSNGATDVSYDACK